MVAAKRDLTAATTAPSADAIPLKLRRGGGTARQVFWFTLIGAVVLAVFASRDLTAWLNRFGDDPILVPLQRAAADWESVTAKLRLTEPHDALRLTIRRLLDWEWPIRP